MATFAELRKVHQNKTPSEVRMEEKTINILTRTSNRPNFFSNCLRSIFKQKGSFQILHIISCDTPKDEKYILRKKTPPWYQQKIIKVTPKAVKKTPRHKRILPHNLYINDLLPHTKPGLILVLDDDDELLPSDALQVISGLPSTHVTLWKVRFPGREIPEPRFWGQRPRISHVASCGYCIPTQYKEYFIWDGYSASDFRALDNVISNGVEYSYLERTLTGLQTRPGRGMRKDIG